MAFWDLLFDRRCCICDKHIEEGAVCQDCDEGIQSSINVGKRKLAVGERFFEVTYLFEYDNQIVQKLLFKLKRSSSRDLFRYAKELYLKAVPDDFCGIVTNCPRGDKSVRNYGYDQVAVPCRIMCEGCEGRLEYQKLFKRKGKYKEQKMLTLEQRKENTKNKFKVIKKDIPKNILIVDDVVTTGSTVSACILELVKHRDDVNVRVMCLASRNTFSSKR